MVIPTKIFEYTATNRPIIFAASGFTNTLISKINGSISFDQCNAESFVQAIILSRKTLVKKEERDLFLDKYDADIIYEEYAKHILYS